MSTVDQPGTPGQNTDPPIPHPLTKLDLSHLAIRSDGALLVSLEDAHDRDLSGREVVAFIVLNDEEAARARTTVEDGMFFAAARVVAQLPRIKKEDAL